MFWLKTWPSSLRRFRGALSKIRRCTGFGSKPASMSLTTARCASLVVLGCRNDPVSVIIPAYKLSAIGLSIRRVSPMRSMISTISWAVAAARVSDILMSAKSSGNKWWSIITFVPGALLTISPSSFMRWRALKSKQKIASALAMRSVHCWRLFSLKTTTSVQCGNQDKLSG